MFLRSLMGLVFVMCLGIGHVFAEMPDSILALEVSARANAKDGARWVRLGQAYLDVENWEGAKKAFGNASRSAYKAQAYNGLGLAYMGCSDERRAMQNFRRALSKNKTYLEAQMNLARAAVQFGDPQAERAFKQAIKMDSTYVPAYVELAAWYAEHQYFDAMAELYKTYLKMHPGDLQAYYHLGLREAEAKRFPQILSLCEALKDAKMYEPRWLPMEAQALAAQGDFNGALSLFQRFFVALPDSERAYYDDLSLVAYPQELLAFNAIPQSQRENFLRRFWQKRDPTLVSWGKARRVEHYRRVWHARTFFSMVTDPWDKRGEVYVRFGEPDYRSFGYKYSPPPPSAVENVKIRTYQDSLASANRLFDNLPEAEQAARREYAREYSLMTPGMSDMPDSFIQPAYPLDPEFTVDGSWESWVYTGIGRGIELVFVRWVGDGQWAFAPVPKNMNNIEMTSFIMDYNPARVYEEVVRETPTYYTTPHGAEPLDFYYDLATFRGTDGKSTLDVYYGIPMAHLQIEDVMSDKQIRVERTVALSAQGGETVHRSMDDIVLPVSGLAEDYGDQFCVDVVALDVPPGDYQLAVQVADRVSGALGIYVQNLSVEAFSDSLAMSDLVLANTVEDQPQHKKFKKGDVWVIPMPSRSFLKKQNPHVYYEVYHLTRDEFGQTRFEVIYTVRHDVRRGAGVFGALSTAVRKLFTTGKPEVSLRYERKGTETYEPIYFELDEGDIRPGLSELEVRITDLNAERSVVKKAMFLMGQEVSQEKMAKKNYIEEAQHFAKDMMERRREIEREQARKDQEIREKEREEALERQRRQNQ